MKFVDGYGRKVDYLRVSVTDRCNLRCVYCMPPEGIELEEPDEILRYEEILRVARIAAARGVSKIRITGGEPLVRKGLVEFVSELASIEGVDDLSLTTNGVLLERYAEELKKAGLKRVNVSLDSLDRTRVKRLTRGDVLDRVLGGLEAALEAGLLPVKVNMVVIKGFNDDEIEDFAGLSMKRPYHVRFIEYMPFDVEEGWQTEKCVPAGEILQRLKLAGPLEPVGRKTDGAGPARRFAYRGAPGEVGLISPVTEHFCGSCNRLRLTAAGKLRTCLFSDEEIDVKKALRCGSGDKEVEDVLFRAVVEKPAGHNINENVFKKCSRTMSLIGG